MGSMARLFLVGVRGGEGFQPERKEMSFLVGAR
jgi:hypothetical protein